MTRSIFAVVCATQLLAASSHLFGDNETSIQPRDKTAEASNEVHIKGAVHDLNDRPVGGAKVGVVYLSRRPKSDPLYGGTIAAQVGTATTDADGRFQLSVRKKIGDDIALELSATATGHGVALRDLPVGVALHDVTLRLPNETRRPATLLAPDGTPLPMATLKLCGLLPKPETNDDPEWYSAPSNGVSSWPPNCVSGADGNCALLASDSVSKMLLEIDDDRVARQRWTVAIAKANALITLRTEPTRSAEGQVVAADTREPLAGADVSITSWNGGEYVGAVTTKTDERGDFGVRTYVGDRVTIRAQLASKKLQLACDIPWIEGTTRQRMVLPLFRTGAKPQDGTTPDGKPATTIDVEIPTAQPTISHPTQPISAALPGTIVVSESLPGDETMVHQIVAINPTSSRSRILVKNGMGGNISPDGKHILYFSGTSNDDLSVASVGAVSSSRKLATKCIPHACWLKDGACVANIDNPARQDYYGQIYWPLERSKRKFDLNGKDLGRIAVPAPYEAFDVSHDGTQLAMHWDTHCASTGAQLYVAAINGSKLGPIARKRSQYYWYPRFSPDDKFVVAKHLNAKTGEHTVRTLALDGTSERCIVLNKDVGPEVACWSPDGAWIAIIAYEKAAFDGGKKLSHLFVVDAAGERIQEIAASGNHERQITNVDWTAASLIAN